MRKLLLPLVLLATLGSYACETFIKQLCNVNAEWKNHSDGISIAAKTDFSKNKTFDDWIATHLMLVEQTLRQRPVNHLSDLQKQNRFRLLDELNAYWHYRAFPVNDYLSYKNPIFIDRYENYCAVGHLMKQSGAISLAKSIDKDNKFVYVKEIKTKGLMKWADEKGFTKEELAWIQPGYPVSFTTEGLSGGFNGPVNSIVVNPSSQVIYAGGSFTQSTKGVVCNNVSAYISGIAGWDWISLGTGLNGTVNALLLHNDKLYVGGDFSMAGTLPVSNVAVYDLQTGQWQAMGTLDNSVNALTVYNNEIYAGGKFTGYVSKWTGSQWQDITLGFIYGDGAKTLEVWNNTLMIGGDFELITGALRKNVAAYDGVQMTTSGFGTVTPVNDFEIHNDTLYAACNFVDGADTCALARFNNYTNDWETILKPFSSMADYFDGTSINHLLSIDQKLFCAGTFFTAAGMSYGNNLMHFQTDGTNDFCIPMMIIDSGINSIAAYGNSICIGGTFTNSMSDTLNHIGLLKNVLTNIPVPHYSSSRFIDVYPNPATDFIIVDLKDISVEKGCFVKIIDATGCLIYKEEITNPLFSIDLSSKKLKGVFFVQMVDSKGEFLVVEKIVIE
jgi:hypothetical protein